MDVLALNTCNFMHITENAFIKIQPIQFWTFMEILLKFCEVNANIPEDLSFVYVRTSVRHPVQCTSIVYWIKDVELGYFAYVDGLYIYA